MESSARNSRYVAVSFASQSSRGESVEDSPRFTALGAAAPRISSGRHRDSPKFAEMRRDAPRRRTCAQRGPSTRRALHVAPSRSRVHRRGRWGGAPLAHYWLTPCHRHRQLPLPTPTPAGVRGCQSGVMRARRRTQRRCRPRSRCHFIHSRSHHVVSGASFLAYFSSHFLLYVTRQALETTTPTRHSARTERYSARMEASHPHPPISSRGGAQKPLHQHVSSYFTLRTR